MVLKNAEYITMVDSIDLLLVEDGDISFVDQCWLGDYNFRVDLANDGQEALDKLTSASYDVVVMDLGEATLERPYDLVEKVRELKPGCVIIGVTNGLVKEEAEPYFDAVEWRLGKHMIHIVQPVLEAYGFKIIRKER